MSLPEATTEDMESCCRCMMMEVADLSFFDYQVMVQDERAHKYVNANRGSGGAEPRIFFFCQNCVQRNSGSSILYKGCVVKTYHTIFFHPHAQIATAHAEAEACMLQATNVLNGSSRHRPHRQRKRPHGQPAMC